MSNGQALSDTSGALYEKMKMRKFAHVVADDLQFGFARAWEMMAESRGLTDIDIKLFKNRNAAVEWVMAGS